MLKKLQHNKAKKLCFIVSKLLANWHCAKSMVDTVQFLFFTPRIMTSTRIAVKFLIFLYLNDKKLILTKHVFDLTYILHLWGWTHTLKNLEATLLIDIECFPCSNFC